MKRSFLTLLAAFSVSMLLVSGCNKDSSQGGTDNSAGPAATGRGSGANADNGGNGKVYERGGAPDSANPSRQVPGSGRVDRGGGVTAGGTVDHSTTSETNTAYSSSTNAKPTSP